jgi:F0F1-type ATP synthase gamma subunit
MELYATGAYDKIVIVYNSFKNAATQIVTEETSYQKPIEKPIVEGTKGRTRLYLRAIKENHQTAYTEVLKTII